MSNTIDQRVVEMRFDNRHFESNVQTSLSTLDKLKQSLNLHSASKGLESINTAAKNVNMSGLGAAVETVQAKFSALEVMGVTALANITNSAVNAGKRMISALTIDPVKTGLSEYETKINAIQVIQANTRGKNTMDDITAALEDLNTYADKTIYNFAQMTDNIGKFTAQGLDVYAAADAVKGMANLAAASGASAQDMARATYQISQSLSSSIKLMDWNSLRNANMATTALKDTLIDLARVHGIAIDDMIAQEGSFEQTLSKGWLSGEMFTEAMNIYSGVYTDAELAAKGFNESQIKNFKELAAMAESAATEVKTFTQLWDVLKETAQSGWTQSWEILIGDFESAKKNLTQLQIFLSDIINGWSDARNFILKGVMTFTDPWNKLMDKLEASGLGKIKDVAKSVSDAADKVKYFQEVVSGVWHGDYNNRGDDPDRFDLLTAAGYDPRVVQDLVNKGLGYEVTMEDIVASHEKFGLTLDDVSDSTDNARKAIAKLSDEQLREAGLTEDEIELFRALEKESERTGDSIEELTKRMSENDGRSLLIGSLKNIWDALSGLANAAKTAWVEIFDPPNSGELIIILYNALDAINQFTAKLRFTDKETGELTDTAEKFIRIFKGMFSAIHIVTTILGGGFRIAFEFLRELLKHFDVDILELVARIGDAIVSFDEWISETLDFSDIIKTITPYLEDAIQAVKDWFKAFKDSGGLEAVTELLLLAKDAVVAFVSNLHFAEGFSTFTSSITEFLKALKELLTDLPGWLAGIKTAEDIPMYIVEGLVNGLRNGVPLVIKAIVELAKGLWQAFCDFLGIESPSKKFMDAGGYVIQGLQQGIQNGAKAVVDTIVGVAKTIVDAFRSIDFSPAVDFVKGIWNGIVEFVKAIDWDKVISLVVVGALLATVKKVADTLAMFTKPLNGLGEMFEGIGEAFEGLGASFKANAWKKKSQAILILAIAIGVLSASVYALSKVEPEDLVKAGIALLALVGVISLLGFVAKKMDTIDDVGKKSLALVGIAASLLIVAFALKSLSTIAPEQALTTIEMFAAIVVGLIAVVASIGLLVKGKTAQNIDKAGWTIAKVAAAMMTMVYVMKKVSQLDATTILKGVGFMGGFIIFVGLLMKVTRTAGKNVDKVGSMLLKLTIAMGLMVGVIKLINLLSWEEMGKGAIGMVGFALFVGLLVKVTRTADKHTAKIGGTLLAISASMLILTGVMKLIAGMSWGELGKGVVGVAALSLVVKGLINVVKSGGPGVGKLAGTLLAMSAAIGILAIVAVALSFIDIGGLAKGIIAVGLLGLIMSAMLKAASGLDGGMGTVIALTVAVGILAGAVAALSFIDTKDLYSAVGAMVAVLAAFSLLMAATGKAGSVKITQFLSLIIVVGILSTIIWALSALNVQGTLTTVASLSLLLIAMSGALVILKYAGQNSAGAVGCLMLMGIVVAELAAILWGLSALDVHTSMANVLGLTVLLAAITGALVLLQITHTNGSVVGAVGCLMLMGIVVAELAAILYGLSALDVQTSMSNVLGISVLLAVMTGALLALQLMHTNGSVVGAVGCLMLMGIVVAELAAILYGLSALEVQTSMTNVAALSILLAAMTGALLLLQFVHTNGTIVGAVGCLMLMGIVVAELAAVLWGMSELNVNPSIETAGALSLLLIAMSGSLILLGVVGTMGPAAFIGIGALATLIAGIGGLIVAIGALVEKFPMLESFLNTGIPIIEKIGYAIGSFFGNIAAGFLGNLTSGLPAMATDLSNFMTNLQPFIEGSKNIDFSVIEGIGYLSGAIIALSVADLIQGITSFIQFGSSLSELGTELSMFMMNAMPFIMGAAAIKPEMMEGIKTLAEVILILTAADILEGLTSWFTGGSSLTSFGEQLAPLGTYISQFATNLGTFGPEQIMSVNSAALAIQALATAANSLPNEGGWLAKIVGDNSIATFGSYLPDLGTNLAGFVTNLGTFTADQVATVGCAAGAIKVLAQAAEEIPNDGGLWAAIVGENSLATFGSYLPDLGTHLNEFVSNLGTFSEDQVNTVECAASAIKTLATAANEIPNEGGIWASIFGDNSLSAFGGDLPELGTNLADFVGNLGTFSEDQVATVKCAGDAITALATASKNIDGQAEWAKKLFGDNGLSTFGEEIKGLGSSLAGFVENLGTFTYEQVSTVKSAVAAVEAFAKLADADLKGAKNNLGGFGDKMVALGTDVSDFVKKMPATSSLDTAIKNLDKILKAIKDISGADPEVATKFTESLSKIGKDAVKKFVEAFTSNSAKEDVKKAAAALMDKAKEGAESKKETITKAVANLAKDSATGFKEAYDTFYKAGANLVDGFAAGISDNDYKAAAKAAAMAAKAAKDAKAEIEVNSPSKVFMRIGSSVPEGFAMGIESMNGAVKASVVSMTDAAVSGVGNSISRIADAITTDIDAQPTIRPVLDLSDIESGASTIGDLLGNTSSVGVLSKVGTISSMMNRRSQNGEALEIVSAIDKLRKDLGTNRGDTYNINGVTYDGESGVSDAVQAIARYALMERRI